MTTASTAASVARGPAAGTEARAKAFREARRHSFNVRLMKLALPVAAVLLGLSFIGYSFLATPLGVSVDIGGTAIEGGKLVMSNPRLDGFTRDNRPYTMRAERAMQDIGNGSVIELERLDARVPTNDSGWADIVAEYGVLDRNANTLELTQGMTVRLESGVVAHFQTATVHMTTGELDSDDPVSIELEGTRIDADSMRIAERGAVMIFENRVRMEIEGGRLQSGARDAENTSVE